MKAKSSHPRIIARIFGGLGNQLFCYAAARRLALVNSADLVLDDVSGFVRDYDYKRRYQLDHFNIACRKATPAERLEPLSRIRRYLKRVVNRQRPFEERSYIHQEGVDFDPRLLVFKPCGTVYVEGYWQSEQYFKDVEPTIREELRIIPPKDETNRAMAEAIHNCQSVAVHVRFFDDSGEQGVSNAPGDYYARAIASMDSLVSDAHYFVFSDRSNTARARIPLPDRRVTFVAQNQGDENAYIDLWLMTLCRHFITANSTFSWWGAWLGSEESKVVMTPNLKVDGKAAWGFKGLIPDDWVKV